MQARPTYGARDSAMFMNRVDTIYKSKIVTDELKASMQLGGAAAVLAKKKYDKIKNQERFKN